VYDGLNIRWRETAPDRALVSMALAELEELHQGSTDAVQCEIVIERVARGAACEARTTYLYHALVDIGSGVGRRERRRHLQADALSSEPARALRSAFGKLKAMAPTVSQSQAA
jgi:hypothetical protein